MAQIGESTRPCQRFRVVDDPQPVVRAAVRRREPQMGLVALARNQWVVRSVLAVLLYLLLGLVAHCAKKSIRETLAKRDAALRDLDEICQTDPNIDECREHVQCRSNPRVLLRHRQQPQCRGIDSCTLTDAVGSICTAG
jgi:hypothetical protein